MQNMQNFSNDWEQWFYPFHILKKYGKISKPRGQEILEIQNFQVDLNPLWNLCKYKARKINTGYLIGEMLWYLEGDRNDTSIEYYAKFWAKVKNKSEPLFNSNYGYYAFTEDQFNICVKTLLTDKDSRQAVIIIADSQAYVNNSNDIQCTYSVSFRIRDNKLNMSVNMRSNDIWKGFCIDVFQFSIWQQLMRISLLRNYPDLELGVYTHKADSFHVYTNDLHNFENLLYTSAHGWDDSIENAPPVSHYDYAFGFSKLQLLEQGLRCYGNSSLVIEEGDFTKWAAQQLIKFTRSKHGL